MVAFMTMKVVKDVVLVPHVVQVTSQLAITAVVQLDIKAA